MVEAGGLRDRKKARTRRHIADVAAALFAERGYDAVSMADVARAADVSDQTVYNYFPAKQDLVLDRAEQIRGWYRRAVRERGPTTSPARALEPLVRDDIERYRLTDLGVARGEFPAQCVDSAVLRRFALEERERQARTIADAIGATNPDVAPVLAHAHAAGLVAVVQLIHDQIGGNVRDRAPQGRAADHLHATAHLAFTHLDQAFAGLVGLRA